MDLAVEAAVCHVDARSAQPRAFAGKRALLVEPHFFQRGGLGLGLDLR